MKQAFSIPEARRLYLGGYRHGFECGEQAARLSDLSFIEAIARRLHALEAIEGQIGATLRETIAMHAALKARGGDRS